MIASSCLVPLSLCAYGIAAAKRALTHIQVVKLFDILKDTYVLNYFFLCTEN